MTINGVNLSADCLDIHTRSIRLHGHIEKWIENDCEIAIRFNVPEQKLGGLLHDGECTDDCVIQTEIFSGDSKSHWSAPAVQIEPGIFTSRLMLRFAEVVTSVQFYASISRKTREDPVETLASDQGSLLGESHRWTVYKKEVEGPSGGRGLQPQWIKFDEDPRTNQCPKALWMLECELDSNPPAINLLLNAVDPYRQVMEHPATTGKHASLKRLLSQQINAQLRCELLTKIVHSRETLDDYEADSFAHGFVVDAARKLDAAPDELFDSIKSGSQRAHAFFARIQTDDSLEVIEKLVEHFES